MLAAMVTLGVLVLPIVIITSAEALRSVPTTLREAGYGVGASRWEVTRKLVLPAAVPGILTGTVLALARALGETAPLLLVGAVLGGFSTPADATIPDRLAGSYTALPVTIFQWSKQPQDEFRELAAAAIVVLLVVTLFANAVAVLLRNRYEQRW
jgi:phosphate transport system permease protein